MMCARCNKPIVGKPKPVVKHSASGGGSTVYVCPDPCQAPPHQTAPTDSPLSRHVRRSRR